MLMALKRQQKIKISKKLSSKCLIKVFSVVTDGNENGKLRLAVFCLGCGYWRRGSISRLIEAMDPLQESSTRNWRNLLFLALGDAIL